MPKVGWACLWKASNHVKWCFDLSLGLVMGNRPCCLNAGPTNRHYQYCVNEVLCFKSAQCNMDCNRLSAVRQPMPTATFHTNWENPLSICKTESQLKELDFKLQWKLKMDSLGRASTVSSAGCHVDGLLAFAVIDHDDNLFTLDLTDAPQPAWNTQQWKALTMAHDTEDLGVII